jgi:hypothetical protein
MSMNKVAGLIFFDKIQKNPKSTVAGIFGVPDKSRRRMTDDQIDSPAAPQGKTHFADKPGHLFFGILINVAVIPS